MQTVETLNEGLKRAYTITIKASEIEARVNGELKKVAPRVRMPGFRPGKVPANLVRKMHGDTIEQQALESAVQEGIRVLFSDKKLRPAVQPQVELKESGPGADVVVEVTLETLPEIPALQIDALKLERLTVEPDEAAVSRALDELVQGQKSFDLAPVKHTARKGDLVVVDFEGKVDGVVFEGGKGAGISVELGSGQFIPGFEDQLIGVAANEQKTINVTFPKDYNVDYLKGKAATFDVVVNEVQTPRKTEVNDDFAKSMGLESLDQLRILLKEQLAQELNGLTRTHMKRKLLDQLAATHDFPVPPAMVEAEFVEIWKQLEHEASHEADPAAARKEMESEKGEYRAIAERRVRLGLLLSEIGTSNGIEITAQEMSRLVAQAAQQYRHADRQKFIQYIQQEPLAAAQLRAPLFEDKVVDFLFERAEISDRTVTRAELETELEAEVDGHAHGPGCGHDHAAPKTKQGKTQKSGAKQVAKADEKAKAKPAAKAKTAAAKPAAKKAPTKKKG